jgi:hypothetical protein
MSGKQTYQQEEQIRRYLQDQMTDAERYAFEREMQRDPFLAEAVEGFSASDADLVFADLTNLRARLEKPKKNRIFIWYAAASVLLLVVSSVVLFNWQENVIPVVSENVIQKEAKPKEIRNKETTNTKFTSPTVVPKENKQDEVVVADNESIDEMVVSETEMESVSVTSLATTDSGSSAVPETIETQIVAEETIQLADSTAKTSNTEVSSVTAQQAQLKEAESMFAKKKSELNEVVVVGYGTKRKSDMTGSVSSVASKQIIDGKAFPVGGWKAFEEYLKTQVLAPKVGKPGKKTIVRLSFAITETGEKVDYEILKGDDETYNKEAIRIINEGPVWIPEVKGKTPQKSVIKLKLVFEP